MENIIIIVIVVAVVTLASLYIYKEKKKGNKCIGCPAASSCKSCSCNGHKPNTKPAAKRS